MNQKVLTGRDIKFVYEIRILVDYAKSGSEYELIILTEHILDVFDQNNMLVILYKVVIE